MKLSALWFGTVGLFGLIVGWSMGNALFALTLFMCCLGIAACFGGIHETRSAETSTALIVTAGTLAMLLCTVFIGGIAEHIVGERSQEPATHRSTLHPHR